MSNCRQGGSIRRSRAFHGGEESGLGVRRGEEEKEEVYVLYPVVSVLVPTSIQVTMVTVDDHHCEESDVKVRNGALESATQTPRDTKNDVAGVRDLQEGGHRGSVAVSKKMGSIKT